MNEIAFKSVASLIAEPARAAMLWTLLDGRALTATELAIRTDLSLPNASMHLKKLVDAEILKVESQGRHRYFRYSTPEVAYAVEGMASLVSLRNSSCQTVNPASGITYCRTCYDHLAGKVAVSVADCLITKNLLIVQEQQFDVTAQGELWFGELGIETGWLRSKRRIFARRCMDWSERRHHLAGELGAALLETLLARKWIKPKPGSREMTITDLGRQEFHRLQQLML